MTQKKLFGKILCNCLVCAFAGLMVALCGCDNTSTPEDETAELIIRAVRGGKFEQKMVGLCFLTGKYGFETNFTKAAMFYRLAADQGESDAQRMLGILYQDGRGVAQDYREAMKWYRKAAARGDGEAQTRLGLMYLAGEGVPKDMSEASRWLLMAAENGDFEGQVYIGCMYLHGRGVKQDDVEAFRWFRKSALAGVPLAQLMLAEFYFKGKGGVPYDKEETKKWLQKAIGQSEGEDNWVVGNVEAILELSKRVDQGDDAAKKALLETDWDEDVGYWREVVRSLSTEKKDGSDRQ